ncbi:MAG: asparagine synthase (glutamine-hydrolyzing) [Parcubacteria group bacterium CG11_big_fil_rev_8_21_14_0_20_41_14]|nr:MAG: asparagine synthase (glutamine-hydrolyzing) [Parcubacteria group bacterium CG11_big_fil_rev_8_21_14_0_20_41_14]
MCGINGFNFNDKNALSKMNKATTHRGPDDVGEFASVVWSLGHNRLSIIDLSKAGHQPMKSAEEKFVIVFNGEIYNFEDVKKELLSLGHVFKSKTDTEVILNAYAQWGPKCLQKFNGMFALAILNTQTEELFVARDRIGIKPLYYYHKDNKFIFSSEAKAILAHNVDAPLNYESLNIYLRLLYVPSPLTMWKNIFKLEPAHYLLVNKSGEVKKTKYWEIKNDSLLDDKEQIKREVHDLLYDSVQKRLMSDRPVGVFLSGGIDSTIITGIMSKLSDHVNTFSIGFQDTEESEKYNNDFLLARKTAEHFNTEHHEYIIRPQDILDNLEKTIYHMDEPISNHIQTVNMLLARYATDFVKVVLGGDGGDELFGGYERYYYNAMIEKLRFVPGAGFVMKALGKSSEKLHTEPGHARYMSFFAQKEGVVASFLKSHNNFDVLPEFLSKRYFDVIDKKDFTRQFMRTDIQSWIPDESLMRSDKMSMAYGLEQRVPFLDHRLVELADRIPVKYKLGSKGFLFGSVGKHYEGKIILREAMAEYLPDFVLNQPKWGWFSPAAKWVRGPLKPLMREVLSSSYCAGTSDLFDFTALQKMLDDHIAKKSYCLNTLWSVMTFQLWYSKFMK